MKLFSWLIDKIVKSRCAGSCRPAWAAEVSAVSQPILLFSERSQFNAYGSDQQETPPNGTDSSDALRTGNGVSQPVCGANNAVPWPMPVLNGADVVSFWGTGSAITTELVLPSDAALRIVAQGGPIEIRVGRDDGTFLDDTASAEAIVPVFGLMAIPASGTYVLAISAATEVKWGVSVVYLRSELILKPGTMLHESTQSLTVASQVPFPGFLE
jgi:hypothetical protein